MSTTDDLVLVDVDADAGRLYESYSGGYPIPRATWDEYQRKVEELELFVSRLISGEYVGGWKFRGERPPQPTPHLLAFLGSVFPLFPPLHNRVPRVQ